MMFCGVIPKASLAKWLQQNGVGSFVWSTFNEPDQLKIKGSNSGFGPQRLGQPEQKPTKKHEKLWVQNH